MSSKDQYLRDTRSFPDSTVVTFEGKKTTLGELRQGTSFTPPVSGSTPTAGLCPKCKSLSTVIVAGVNFCNSCGASGWR
jgi:hypothetical protein